jgi:hypothetical protein
MPRSLAPTLGLIALAGIAAGADPQWTKPEFSFGGFAQTTFAIGNDAWRDNAATSQDEDRWYDEFKAYFGVHSDIRLNDAVGARLDLWLQPWSTTYADPELRDGFLWVRSGDWTVRVGREIRRFGWISPQLDQLYRVNASTIGYLTGEPYSLSPSIFGQDSLGGSLTWQRGDVPIEVTALLNNGFWTSGDGGDRERANTERERNGLGYGIDVTYRPVEQATIALGIAYEPKSGSDEQFVFGIRDGWAYYPPFTAAGTVGSFARSTGGLDQGGDAWLLDLDATVKPSSQLTLGGEIARFSIGDGRNNGDRVADSDYERWQGLAMANWAFQGTRFPMSVTGMIQHIRAENGDGSDGSAWEYTTALLTRPFERIPLHLDAELAYFTVETDQEPDSHGIQLAGRALLTF